MSSAAPWARLDDLLDAALSRPPQERRRYLDDACRGDAALRAQVEGLLAIAESEDGELRPGGGLDSLLAREVLDDLDGEEKDVPLPPGTRLGRFEVTRFLGAGSVGRVYRAVDPTLGREVAIKALAEAFRSDAVALRRFEREARVLATVNHPNVAAIHGLEIIDGAPYLVLELVEGETLEERLRRGPMAVDKAVEVARQIAEALEEAHRKGVVHRDLKPANVKLTAPGRVKVLDFGLARALDPTGPETLHAPPPTVTSTGTGAIQGTAPYMSPEQARGLPLDARSDVWAFGCVLYEMLVGRRAFGGGTVADVLAAVVRDTVDFDALPAGLHPGLRRLVERCLRRDPRQRLQDIGDARLELSELGAGTEPPPVRARGRRVRQALLLMGAGAALVTATALLGAISPPRAPQQRALQAVLPPPPGVALADDLTAPFALSPDGSTLVFLGEDGQGPPRLRVRRLDELEARVLPGTEDGRQPFFSPDGRWVAFFADRKLKKVDLAGGLPVPLADLGARPRGGWWGSDGAIVVSRSSTSGVSRVSENGGRLEELTRPDVLRDERAHCWPQLLPGSEVVIFTVDREGAGFEKASVEALSLRTGERRVLVPEGTYGRFVPPGRLVYAHEGRLFSVGFDPDRVEVEGPPTLVVPGVRVGATSGGAHAAMADDGTLLYVPDLPLSRDRHLAWMDAQGRRTHLPGPPRRFREPRLSPRGDRVALRVGEADNAEVWIQDLASGTLAQLTFGLRPWRPLWTPDGKALVVSSNAQGRWRLLLVPVSGGAPRVLHEGPFRLYPGDWSPDGRSLVFQELNPQQGWNVAVLDLAADGRAAGPPRPLAATGAHETYPRLSRDGRWLAYVSNELDDTMGVYVVPFGRPGPRINPSREGGRWPVWGRAGELFYWAAFPAEMHRVAWHEDGPAFSARTDDVIWPRGAPGGPRPPSPPFDFEPASGQFLFLEAPRPEAARPAPHLTLFVGWSQQASPRVHTATTR